MKVENKGDKGNPWHSDKNGQFTSADGGGVKSLDEKNKENYQKTIGNEPEAKYNNVKLVGVIDRIMSFETKEDNQSYDYETGEVVDFDDGFMVSFHQNEDDGFGGFLSHFGKYTPEQYDQMATEFANKNKVDAITIGVYGGQPEISFKVKSIKQAWKLMIEHNQESIYDNRGGGKLILNPYYVSSKNPMPGERRKDKNDILRILQNLE